MSGPVNHGCTARTLWSYLLMFAWGVFVVTSQFHSCVHLAMTQSSYLFSFVLCATVMVIRIVIRVVMAERFVWHYIVVFQTRNCLVCDKNRIKTDIHNKFTAVYVSCFIAWCFNNCRLGRVPDFTLHNNKMHFILRLTRVQRHFILLCIVTFN
jgi:hypothetical protein